MDDLLARIEALESQSAALQHQARGVERRLRWWRGGTCGLLALALLTRALPEMTLTYDVVMRVALWGCWCTAKAGAA